VSRSRRTDVLLFFTLLKPMLRRDLPLGEGLRAMRGDGGMPDDLLASMASEIDDGAALSEAMERRPESFPAPLPALVSLGERTGDTASAVERCIDQSRRRVRATGHVRAALVYPGICLALVVGLVLLHIVLLPPGILDQALSPPRSVLRSMVSVAVRFVAPAGAAAMATAVWLIFVRTARVPWTHRARLNAPAVGRLYRLSAAAGFTRALGALLAAGLPVDRAVLAAIPSAGNVWVEDQLRSKLLRVRDGQALSRALSLPGVFPPSLTWRLAVAEEKGALPEALQGAASSYEQELEVYSGRLARLVEPAGMIAVGLLAMLVVWIGLGSVQTRLGVWP